MLFIELPTNFSNCSLFLCASEEREQMRVNCQIVLSLALFFTGAEPHNFVRCDKAYRFPIQRDFIESSLGRMRMSSTFWQTMEFRFKECPQLVTDVTVHECDYATLFDDMREICEAFDKNLTNLCNNTQEGYANYNPCMLYNKHMQTRTTTTTQMPTTTASRKGTQGKIIFREPFKQDTGNLETANFLVGLCIGIVIGELFASFMTYFCYGEYYRYILKKYLDEDAQDKTQSVRADVDKSTSTSILLGEKSRSTAPSEKKYDASLLAGTPVQVLNSNLVKI